MTSSQLQSLEARLTALHETHKTTLQLITRLANLKFQPGSLSLSNDGENVQTELTSEIHEGLKKEDEELEILKQEVQDVTTLDHGATARRDTQKGKEQARLAVQLARLGEDFKNARARFRSAQVQSKRNAQLARIQERDLLFNNKSDGQSEEAPFLRRARDRPKGQDEAVAASGDVTAALRRTQQLLLTEVQRSHFAQEIFDQSSEAIKNLSETYNDLDSLLSSSKTLVSTLVKSTKSDTWYLETSVYILLATISWLLFRRVFWYPFWLLVWLIIRPAYRMVFGIFSIIGIGGASKSVAISSSLAGLPLENSIVATPSVIMPGQEKVVSQNANQETGEHPVSDEIAAMADKSQEQGKEKVVRGDGTTLEHFDKPRNPKKRMFEYKAGEEAEKEKAAQKEKDEL
ncbi:hypothetical protein BT63DRAFT_409545 [Microthyrium microscopicum]|uniref:Sec20 C-terminal domain-containing protein n=1 Tax=Microthyrium microscopicum TaxID=703497 RepID=A0A6A6UUG0_9PEZI|nr:hypothetical protein BT63DRAFT_409545 [Microthyrium microscopicum]